MDDVVEICYGPQYWLQCDDKKNFNFCLMLIQSQIIVK
jgi:hypothetical protein